MLDWANFTASLVAPGRDMLYKTRSAAVYGIDAHIIDVEVDFSGVVQKEESFATVGLPDAAVRESPTQTG